MIKNRFRRDRSENLYEEVNVTAKIYKILKSDIFNYSDACRIMRPAWAGYKNPAVV